MKEIIQIGVGHCGIKLADHFIQEISEEHKIGFDGMPLTDFQSEHHYPSIFYDEC